MGRITVSYAGVHQAFQIALAAQEIGELAAFYCALYDDPHKWGSVFGGIVGADSFDGRRADGLALDKVIEYPWPLIWKTLRDRFYPRGHNAWLSANNGFDRWVAGKIEKSAPEIFVGTASCDLHSLKAAKRRGATLLHDCPGLHFRFLQELLGQASDLAGVKTKPRWLFSPRHNAMEHRKQEEYLMADRLLLYSDIHRESFEKAGFSPHRIFTSPLWVDSALWYRDRPKSSGYVKEKVPLRVLFVGGVTLLKGIPFLMAAARECASAIELTIVGPRNAQSELLLGDMPANARCLSPQPKSALRRIYEEHDVLVLPSIADSFGFAALEAMACGLPVIVTRNCGVPVPEASWRVPAMESASLAKRIMQYADDRMLVIEHGSKAAAFAQQFSPERYRHIIGTLFGEILAERAETA